MPQEGVPGHDLNSGRPTRSDRFLTRSTLGDLGWLSLAVIIAFSTAIPGGFVWVDHVEIEQGGYRVQSFQDVLLLWTSSLDQYLDRAGTSIPSGHGGYWRPAYGLHLSLDWALWRDHAWCYHLENVVWHLALVCALYFLGQQLLAPWPEARWISFWATLLFAVHPLGVHSVTWISGRKDVLAALWGVVSLAAFVAATLDNSRRRDARRRRSQLIVSALSMMVAIWYKELAFVIPLAATVLPLIGPQRAPLGRYARRARRLGLAILWSCAAALLVWRALVLHGVGLHASYPTDSIVLNAATSARLFWHYLAAILFPVQPSIADTWSKSLSLAALEIAALSCLALSIVALVIVCLRRPHPAALGVAWYLIWLMPAAGLLPLRHFCAERYLYPASWGIWLSLVAILHSWATNKFRQRSAELLLAVISVCLMATTAYRNLDWWDDARLFGRAVEHHPDYVEGHTALAGLALSGGQYQQSLEHSQQALRLIADRSTVSYYSPFVLHGNLGLAYYHLQQPELARKAFEVSLKSRPASATGHYHLGLAELALGHFDVAQREFEYALSRRPGDALCRGNLAYSLLRLKRYRDCIAMLRPLVQELPADRINRANLASALLIVDGFDEAEPHLEWLVAAQPADAPVRAKLAWCQWKLGHRDAARNSLAQAAHQDPQDPTVVFVQRMITEP